MRLERAIADGTEKPSPEFAILMHRHPLLQVKQPSNEHVRSPTPPPHVYRPAGIRLPELDDIDTTPESVSRRNDMDVEMQLRDALNDDFMMVPKKTDVREDDTDRLVVHTRRLSLQPDPRQDP